MRQLGKRSVAGSPRQDQRRAFRMVSDMVGDGVLQNRTINTGGASEAMARRVHPATELVPAKYPILPAAAIQLPANAAFTCSLCILRVYGSPRAADVLD